MIHLSSFISLTLNSLDFYIPTTVVPPTICVWSEPNRPSQTTPDVFKQFSRHRSCQDPFAFKSNLFWVEKLQKKDLIVDMLINCKPYWSSGTNYKKTTDWHCETLYHKVTFFFTFKLYFPKLMFFFDNLIQSVNFTFYIFVWRSLHIWWRSYE